MVAQGHCCAASLSVLGHVVQPLLGDAVQSDLHIRLQAPLAVHRHRHRHSRPTGDGLRKLAQQIAEAGFGQGPWPQFQQKSTHLRQRTLRQFAQFLRSPSCLVSIMFPQTGQYLGDDARREEGLRDGVV